MSLSVIIAGFLSGVMGAMGLGGGAVLIIYLAIFTTTEQMVAQGINLIFFLPIGAVAVAIYAKKKQIQWKKVLPLALGGLIGSVCGILLSGALGGEITSKIFGALLVVLGIFEIFVKKRKPS